jgi:hypothetical protein
MSKLGVHRLGRAETPLRRDLFLRIALLSVARRAGRFSGEPLDALGLINFSLLVWHGLRALMERPALRLPSSRLWLTYP